MIERNDTALLADVKRQSLYQLQPEAMADKIIDIYEQYGDIPRVQGWLDMIRDDGDPAFAQAAQLLHDYEGPMPPPAELRDQIVDIVANARDRALSSDRYDIAITPEDLYELERPASASLADDLKAAMDNLNDLDPQDLAALEQQYAWLPEARALMNGQVGYGEALDLAIRHDDDAALEAYDRLGNIVRDNDISIDDLNALNEASREIQTKPELAVNNQPGL